MIPEHGQHGERSIAAHQALWMEHYDTDSFKPKPIPNHNVIFDN